VNDECKALIITVNFRRADCTSRFVKSAAGLEGFERCFLAIVDNNSEDDSVSSIQRAIEGLDNVALLDMPQNRGYFGAAREALRQYLSSHPLPEWVIVCNNDIEFGDPHFLSRLFRKENTAAGIIAPCIISALTGHDANPSIRKRPSVFRMWRYRVWLNNYHAMRFKNWLSPMARKVRYSIFRRATASERAVIRRIYAPHGSFLIFSRQLFEAGGFIDDNFFLYAEEFSVAEMCLRLGLPILHDPSLKIWHQEGQSTDRVFNRTVYAHQKRGFEYALSTYKHGYAELGASAPSARTMAGDVPNPQPMAGAGDVVR